MCLNLDNPKSKLIATENMIVFKNLSKNNCSMYNEFKYEIEKVNTKINFEEYQILRWSIDDGYHSHKNFINSFFAAHSAENVFSRDIFIIPKGSEYIEGYYNHEYDVPNYVSSNIIYIGKIYSPMSWIRLLKYIK